MFALDRLSPYFENIHIRLVSFSTGLFTTYIFLSMIPTLVEGQQLPGRLVWFILFWGFVMFHIAEKYVWQHESIRKRRYLLVHLRTFAFFINHILLGIAVVFFFRAGQVLLGYISFIPIFFHLLGSSLIVEHLHHKVRGTKLSHIISSLSLFFGALIATLIEIPLNMFYGVFAFLIGVILYIVVRDAIPSHKEGNSTWFLYGVIIYLIVMFLETMVVI